MRKVVVIDKPTKESKPRDLFRFRYEDQDTHGWATLDQMKEKILVNKMLDMVDKEHIDIPVLVRMIEEYRDYGYQEGRDDGYQEGRNEFDHY